MDDKVRLGRLQESKGQADSFNWLQGLIVDENFKIKVLEGLALFSRADGFAEERGSGLTLGEGLELID